MRLENTRRLEGIYERWAFGGLAILIDRHGHAVVPPRVFLMPAAEQPGDGMPGHLDVSVFPNTRYHISN